MGGRWKTYLYPFSFRRPRTHLALAPDALWGMHRAELMRWPLAALSDLRSAGFRKLSFRIRGVKGKDSQWFMFKSRKERRTGKNRSRLALPAGSACRNATTRHLSGGRPGPWPRAPIPDRAGRAAQVPAGYSISVAGHGGGQGGQSPQRRGGPGDPRVDDGCRRRRRSEPGKAARLSGKTEHRSSGMAVRQWTRKAGSSSRLGGFPARSARSRSSCGRWRSSSCCVDSLALLAPRSTGMMLNLDGRRLFRGPRGRPGVLEMAAARAAHSILFPGQGCSSTGGECSARSIGSAIVGIRCGGCQTVRRRCPARECGDRRGALAPLSWSSLALLTSGSLLVFFLYLGRRAWRIDQEYRSLAGQALARHRRCRSPDCGSAGWPGRPRSSTRWFSSAVRPFTVYTSGRRALVDDAQNVRRHHFLRRVYRSH